MTLHFIAEWISQLVVAGFFLGIFTFALVPLFNRLEFGWRLSALKIVLITHLFVGLVITLLHFQPSSEDEGIRSSFLDSDVALEPHFDSFSNSPLETSLKESPDSSGSSVQKAQVLFQIPERYARPFALFGIAWAGGTFVLLSYWGLQAMRLHLMLRKCRDVPTELSEILLDKVGVKPRLILTENGSAAFCGGVFKPFVAIPSSLFEELSFKEREILLQHELVHLKSKDQHLLHLQFFTIAFYWWLPSLWLVGRQIVAVCEYRCDSEVLHSGVSSQRYANLLLKVASFQRMSAPANSLPISRHYNETKKRIENILMNHSSKPQVTLAQKWMTLTGGSLVALVFLYLSQLVTLADEASSSEKALAPAKIVVIDAGHGGADSGASVAGILEKDLNLIFAKKLEIALKAKGIKSLMTRDGDHYVTLKKRSEKGDQGKALFVSLHMNSSKNVEHAGIEVFDLKKGEDPVSNQLASELAKNLKRVKEKPTVATRHARLSALGPQCPAALVDLGFLTNPQERGKLLNEDYQDELVEKLTDGIVAFVQR